MSLRNGKNTEDDEELSVREMVRRTISHEVFAMFTTLSYQLGELEDKVTKERELDHEAQNLFSQVKSKVQSLQNTIKDSVRDIKYTEDEVGDIISKYQLSLGMRGLRKRVRELLEYLDQQETDDQDISESMKEINRVTLNQDRMIQFAQDLYEENVNDQLDTISLKTVLFADILPRIHPRQRSRITINPTKGITINGYRFSIINALNNLVGNALKYSKGEVIITVSTDTVSNFSQRYKKMQSRVKKNNIAPNSTWCSISVRDTGPGIPDAHYLKLLKPFFRLNEEGKPYQMKENFGSTNSEVPSENTGVGLTFTQLAVEKHGGELIGQNIQGGYEFVLLLPS